MTSQKRQGAPQLARAAAILLAFAGLIWASHRSGAPAPLPEIALGWALLFHMERAAAVLAVAGAVLLTGWRASRGELPVRLGQIEYEASETSFEKVHESRLRILEVAMGLRGKEDLDRDERETLRRREVH